MSFPYLDAQGDDEYNVVVGSSQLAGSMMHDVVNLPMASSGIQIFRSDTGSVLKIIAQYCEKKRHLRRHLSAAASNGYYPDYKK